MTGRRGGPVRSCSHDPRDTRPVVMELARGKTLERPWKKHGVMPV